MKKCLCWNVYNLKNCQNNSLSWQVCFYVTKNLRQWVWNFYYDHKREKKNEWESPYNTVHEIFSKGFMVPARRNLELLIIGQNWARLKAKVLAHIGNGQKSSPFELYGRSDNVYETCLFSRNFSNLNKIFKTQKGKPILGQKLPNIMPFQMVPCMGAYSEFHH